MNFNSFLSPFARLTSYVVLIVYTKSWKHCLFTLVAHSNLDHTFQVCSSLPQRVAVVLVQGENLCPHFTQQWEGFGSTTAETGRLGWKPLVKCDIQALQSALR